MKYHQTISLSYEVAKFLREESKRTDTPMSHIVDDALKEYFGLGEEEE